MKLKRLFAAILVCALIAIPVFAFSASAISTVYTTSKYANGDTHHLYQTSGSGIKVGNANTFVDSFIGNTTNTIQEILCEPRQITLTGRAGYDGNYKYTYLWNKNTAGGENARLNFSNTKTCTLSVPLSGTINFRHNYAEMYYGSGTASNIRASFIAKIYS